MSKTQGSKCEQIVSRGLLYKMFRLNGLSPFNIEKMAKQTILYNKRIIRLNRTFYTTDPWLMNGRSAVRINHPEYRIYMCFLYGINIRDSTHL